MRLVVSLVLGCSLGCNAFVGLDDLAFEDLAGGAAGSGASGGSGAAGGTAGGGADCPPNSLSAPGLPPDWEGHFAVAVNQPAASCSSSPEMRGYQNLTVPPECDCGCSFDETECGVSLYAYEDLGCNMSLGVNVSLAPGNCEGTTLPPLKFYFETPPTVCGGGVPVPAAPTYDDVLICSVVVESGCSPLPAEAFERRICMQRAGVHVCPAAAPYRYEIATNIEDNRACNGDCACASVDADCGGTVSFFGEPLCSGAPETPPQAVCYDASGADTARFEPSVTGSCVQTAGTVSGEGTGTDMVTICCTDG